MQAMLLAAGMGSRLKEITKTQPKCLVEVSEKPILEWNILKLKEAGFSKIVINLFYRKEQVIEFLAANENFGIDIKLSHEEELYNSGGGIRHAEKLFTPEEPLLVANADILCGIDLTQLYKFHQQEGLAATLVSRAPAEPRVLLFGSADGTLRGWRNKESGDERLTKEGEAVSERGFCGIQMISPVTFPYFGRPEEKRSSIFGYLDAVEHGEQVIEYKVDSDYWFDIGTVEQLEECREFFSQNQFLKE